MITFDGLLTRLPIRWRAPWLVVVRGRSWRGIVATVGAVAIAAVVISRTQVGFAKVVMFYGPPLLALTIFGGIFQHVARGAVWTTLLQRPVAATAELLRITALCAAIYLLAAGILLGSAFVGLASGSLLSSTGMPDLVVASGLWMIVVLCAVIAVSTFATQGAAGIAIAWLMAPVILTLIAPSIELGDIARHNLEFLLPPFDAVFGYSDVLRGKRPEVAVRYTAHLITFPLLCAGIVWRSFHVLARAEHTGAD